MSKIIEHFLVPLFLVVSVLYAFNSFCGETIALNKVYHHTTNNPVHLERANVAMYFSGNPRVQEVKSKTSSRGGTCSFFFPQACISKGECEEMVKRVNSHNDGYRVTIECVTKPVKGIQMVFAVDSNKLSISYELFDSIGTHKGIVFRLHNKDLLRQLEQATQQPVLRTLMHTGKSPRIAIDPGHGGTDSGAIGCNGIQEKNVCLAIGKALGDLLKDHGCDVLLTRDYDCSMLLDQRTSYANNQCADMFISIHANYAANSRALGIETFCMRPNLFKGTFSDFSADQRNCVSGVFNERSDCSYKVAQSVQRHVCDAVALYHDQLIDRKVKFSVAQVLLGAQMPAVLVEVGFVSHGKEAALLASETYQKSVAAGLCNGILAVIAS